jgi:hypothetical protein
MHIVRARSVDRGLQASAELSSFRYTPTQACVTRPFPNYGIFTIITSKARRRHSVPPSKAARQALLADRLVAPDASICSWHCARVDRCASFEIIVRCLHNQSTEPAFAIRLTLRTRTYFPLRIQQHYILLSDIICSHKPFACLLYFTRLRSRTIPECCKAHLKAKITIAAETTEMVGFSVIYLL